MRSAQTFHNYLLERASQAGLEVPMIVKSGEGNAGEVVISAGDHAPALASWIREWRARNPSIVHEIETPEGLSDEDFRNEVR